MTPIVLWTVFVAMTSGTLGFIACALLSAGGEDDAASIERWERCREHLREGVES